jgi:hypothetical protein
MVNFILRTPPTRVSLLIGKKGPPVPIVKELEILGRKNVSLLPGIEPQFVGLRYRNYAHRHSGCFLCYMCEYVKESCLFEKQYGHETLLLACRSRDKGRALPW